MKIILLNACPGAGKDFALLHLQKEHGVVPFSFKTHLVALTKMVYNVSTEDWDRWYSTREGKELPREKLEGLSCRQALIKVSEEVVKPNFGAGYFGKIEGQKLLSIQPTTDVAVCSDCGFNEEVEALSEYFLPEDLWLVKITADGHTWEGDSRGWVTTDVVPDSHYITIHNDKTQMFNTILDDTYNYIMNQ